MSRLPHLAQPAMRRCLRGALPVALTLGLLASTTARADVVYSYVGQSFTIVDSWLYTNGNMLGNTNAFKFTFGTALGANLVMQSVSGGLTAWEAEVLNTPRSRIGSGVANSSVDQLKVSTDAAGHIIDWSIGLTGYTDDIYHGGILGKEFFSSSKTTEALTFYNPPGYTSWLSGSRGGAYGLAYCYGPTCFDSATPGTWTITEQGNDPGSGQGGTLPEPSALALAGLALAALAGQTRVRRGRP